MHVLIVSSVASTDRSRSSSEDHVGDQHDLPTKIYFYLRNELVFLSSSFRKQD